MATLFHKVMKDLDELSKNTAKIAMQKASEELYQTARLAIDDFYKDYTPGDHYRKNNPNGPTERPWFYDRTYNLHNSYKKYLKNNGTVYYGGVILSPEYMEDVYRQPNTQDLIFDLTLLGGVHGLDSWQQTDTRPATPYWITRPAPIQQIQMKYDELKDELDSGKLISDAYMIARKSSIYFK